MSDAFFSSCRPRGEVACFSDEARLVIYFSPRVGLVFLYPHKYTLASVTVGKKGVGEAKARLNYRREAKVLSHRPFSRKALLGAPHPLPILTAAQSCGECRARVSPPPSPWSLRKVRTTLCQFPIRNKHAARATAPRRQPGREADARDARLPRSRPEAGQRVNSN